jgi:hypothetical protein
LIFLIQDFELRIEDQKENRLSLVKRGKENEVLETIAGISFFSVGR